MIFNIIRICKLISYIFLLDILYRIRYIIIKMKTKEIKKMSIKRQTRQINRLYKALDEIIKIHDDGKGSSYTFHFMDDLRDEIARRESINES